MIEDAGGDEASALVDGDRTTIEAGDGQRELFWLEAAASEVIARLKPDPPPRLHFPEAGDYWFVVEAAHDQLDVAKALAVVLSKHLPGVWITLGRIYVRDGRFFWRKRDNTFKFRLVPSTNVHLPREMRAALRGLV